MIAAIYPETSDHNFKLTVKDSQSKQTVKTLRFHLTVAEPVDPVLTYNADADLWANTASFTVTRGSLQGDLGVQYRVSGEERWYDAVMEDKGDGTSIARIAPEWEESEVHPSGVSVTSLLRVTAFSRGKTYEYRLVADSQPSMGWQGRSKPKRGRRYLTAI